MAHTSGGARVAGKMVGWLLVAVGGSQFAATLFGAALGEGWVAMLLCFVPLAAGSIAVDLASYSGTTAGIKNNRLVTSFKGWRSVSGWLIAAVLIGFYVCLYWFPEYLRGPIALVDPLSPPGVRTLDRRAAHGRLRARPFTRGLLRPGALSPLR
ncbi:MAG: hypothetical protein JRF63_06505, partial [Deltaproteobacteria bacterium]|nr:hypothetical protein [Deltaproteobacteria bacterium]